jgi:hypothetical protein
MGRYPTAIRVGCKLHMGWINGWCSVLLSYDGRAENENLVLGCSGVVVSMLVASRGLSVNLSFDLIIFCDGWSWQPAGDQEQAKPELSRAHTVGSALGRIVTWSTDAQIFCLWPMTGFTKSFELVDLQNRLSWRNLDWFFCFLNKKTGSLCIVNDVVLFNIFLLQIFSNFKILNFKRPRWTGKTIPVRFPVLLASHRFFNPTSVRPKIPQGRCMRPWIAWSNSAGGSLDTQARHGLLCIFLSVAAATCLCRNRGCWCLLRRQLRRGSCRYFSRNGCEIFSRSVLQAPYVSGWIDGVVS